MHSDPYREYTLRDNAADDVTAKQHRKYDERDGISVRFDVAIEVTRRRAIIDEPLCENHTHRKDEKTKYDE